LIYYDNKKFPEKGLPQKIATTIRRKFPQQTPDETPKANKDNETKPGIVVWVFPFVWYKKGHFAKWRRRASLHQLARKNTFALSDYYERKEFNFLWIIPTYAYVFSYESTADHSAHNLLFLYKKYTAKEESLFTFLWFVVPEVSLILWKQLSTAGDDTTKFWFCLLFWYEKVTTAASDNSTEWCLFYIWPSIISLVNYQSRRDRLYIFSLFWKETVDQPGIPIYKKVCFLFPVHPYISLFAKVEEVQNKSCFLFPLFYWKNIGTENSTAIFWLIHPEVSLIQRKTIISPQDQSNVISKFRFVPLFWYEKTTNPSTGSITQWSCLYAWPPYISFANYQSDQNRFYLFSLFCTEMVVKPNSTYQKTNILFPVYPIFSFITKVTGEHKKKISLFPLFYSSQSNSYRCVAILWVGHPVVSFIYFKRWYQKSLWKFHLIPAVWVSNNGRCGYCKSIDV
jgi:hypothetical protein